MKPIPKIIAMWSGPRNLSTALMRSFGRRAGTRVWDEPFYAAYLNKTGLQHPMGDAVIADGITDPDAVISACLEPPRPPCQLIYQKHMTQHMVEGFDTSWTARVTNAFLIRSPERVLASYARKRASVSAEDLGFRRQREMFEALAERQGEAPPVIDSTDIRRAPERALNLLCARLGLKFDPAMLSWPAGPAPGDGIWGPHWYDAVWNSTGFAPPESEPPALPDALKPILDAVRDDYLAVARYRIDCG
ncbi:MAG: sulfotransferase family protein [Hyphomicrobiales bacterium]|nr:MAG: sulfotransferase family protein [Hyphomicrobiales bacterium]